MTAAIVRSFETDEVLDGEPSEQLVREASGVEAVPAYRDAAGVWQYVPPREQRAQLEAGRDVVPVYLDVTS